MLGKLSIKTNEQGRLVVLVDDVEVQRITNLRFDADPQGMAVTLRVLVDRVDIEGEADVRREGEPQIRELTTPTSQGEIV